jgi:CRISPR/Cas system CMR-associated protein Cmr1 (group 7 of RAMP superfamily)
MGNIHIFSEKKISNLKLKILKLSKIGLYNILKMKVKSKTWEDYLKIKEGINNE